MDEQNMPEGMNEQGSAQSNAGADDAPKIDLQKAAPAPMQADVQPENTGGPAPDTGAGAVKPGSNKLPLIIGGVIVVLAAAIVLLFSGVFSSGDPKAAVDKAFEATNKSIQARADKIMAEVPGMGVMSNFEPKASKTAYDLQLVGIESDVAGSEEDIALVNSLLAGAGVRGNLVSDPENSITELSGSLHLGDLDLVELYGYISPDLLAFHVPTFSDTVLSINPQTFAQDYKNSPLYDGYSSDEERMEMQELLSSELGMSGAFYGLDYKKMQADMYAIAGKALENAAYEKGAKADGLQQYVIKVPGKDVKTFVIDLVNYIYVDSELGQMYSGMFTAGLDGADSFADLFTKELIEPLQAGMPEMDTTITIGVGAKNQIQTMHFEVTPPAEPIDGVTIESLTADFNIAENGDESLTAQAVMSQNGETMTLAMDVSDSYQDGVYDVDFTMDMNLENAPGSMGGDAAAINMAMDMTADQEGKFDMNFHMGIPMDALTSDFAYDIGGSGAITTDGGKTTYDFPTLSASVTAAGEKMGIVFSLKADSEPIDGPYEFSGAQTPLFGMTAEELDAELQKYNDGLNATLGKLLPLIMSASMG